MLCRTTCCPVVVNDVAASSPRGPKTETSPMPSQVTTPKSTRPWPRGAFADADPAPSAIAASATPTTATHRLMSLLLPGERMVRRLHPGATTLRAARGGVKIYAPSQLGGDVAEWEAWRERGMQPVPVVAEPDDELPAGLAHSSYTRVRSCNELRAGQRDAQPYQQESSSRVLPT